MYQSEVLGRGALLFLLLGIVIFGIAYWLFYDKFFVKMNISVDFMSGGKTVDEQNIFSLYGNLVITNTGNVDITIEGLYVELIVDGQLVRIPRSDDTTTIEELIGGTKLYPIFPPLIVLRATGGSIKGAIAFTRKIDCLYSKFGGHPLFETLIIQTRHDRAFTFRLLSPPCFVAVKEEL